MIAVPVTRLRPSRTVIAGLSEFTAKPGRSRRYWARSRSNQYWSPATTPQNAPPQTSALSTRRTSSSEDSHSAATIATPVTTANRISIRSAPASSVAVSRPLSIAR